MRMKALAQEIMGILQKHKLVVVLRADGVEEALKKAETLIDSGIRCLEVTFTIPDVDQVIKQIAEQKEVLIGAGTVINAKQAELAISAGAKFLVSPGYHAEISEVANQASIPYIPGVLTPTEIMEALQGGHQLLKLFPAKIMGPQYIKALREPFPQVSFLPTGGISSQNMHEWFASGAIAVGMGGALTKGTLDQIREKVREALSRLLD